MNKRLFIIMTFLMIFSLVLAACGGDEATEAPPTEEATEEVAMPEETEEPDTGMEGVPEECADNPDETVCAVIEPGNTIKIGYAGPMTGDYSAFGIDISNAELLAAQEAEPLNGFSFEVLVEDTQGSGEGGAAVANLYVSDPDVVAIAAHTFSGSTAAAIPIYEAALRPMMSPSATRADLTQDNDIFNRIPFTDDIQGTNAAQYLYETLGLTKLAVMHDGDAYGKGLAEKVQEVFTELGGEVVAFEAITPGETDYSAVLTDISARGPEGIFYGGYYSEAAVIASNMPVAGLSDVVLFSDDGSFGASFIELAGDQAEGVYATSALPPSSPERDAFDALFEETYGSVPGELSTFTWHGWDVVNALIYAINQVAVLGDDGSLYIPRQALVDAVNNLSGFEGLTGTISCSDGECNTAGPTFFIVQDGEWVEAVGGAVVMPEPEQPMGPIMVEGVPEECADNPDETVCAVIEPDNTIKIGYAGPMTGDYSAFGIDISNAELLAAQEAEPLGGFSFEVLVEDTQGSGEGGAAVANLYVSDPDVVAIAAHTFSGSTAAAIPIYEAALRPMMSPSATRADLTQDNDIFNRIPFTDDIQGTNAAQYLYETLGLTKLAVMHDGDAYGKGLAEKVQEVFTELGGEVVAFEAITPGETDYSAVLTDISARGPEGIFYGGYYSEAAVIASNMPVAGLSDVVLFSDDGSFGASFIELAGDQAEGVYATSALPPSSPERDAFDALFEETYGSVPGELSTFTWHGWDVVNALIYAINQVAVLGDDGSLYIPRQALVDAVNNLSGFEGLTGTISCSDGECNTAGPTFFIVQDGAWVEAP